MEVITNTDLELPLFQKGKVRDTYVLDNALLMVATDRLSAFDVVFNEGIPHKGHVLNQLSVFWFNKTKHIIENHLVSTDIPSSLPTYLKGRSMIVKKAKPVRLECVVRGYITGSAWKEYQTSQSVCGISLPAGLKNGSKFPKPLFTPSTKAEKDHDENINEKQAIDIVGESVYKTVKEKSIALYEFAASYALTHGLVLADTKFEFGILEENGKQTVILIDEALTPDSSRYWLKIKYDSGELESLDKQFVRNYLETLSWNKAPPAPALPADVIKKTTGRYLEAYRMLTGNSIRF